MLGFFRRQSENKIIKFFLGLIMVTFVLWGFGSFLSGSSGNENIAVVGSEKVTEKEWYRALGQQVNFRERIFGRKLTDEELNDYAFRKSVIDMVINKSLLEQEAEKLKLFVGNDTAALNIAENSFFRDEDGAIDRDKFERYLKYQNFTESQFFEAVRSDLSSGFLMDSVKNADIALDSVAELLAHAYYAEHFFDVYILDSELVAHSSSSSEEELYETYKRDMSIYSFPERRKLLYIVFSADDVEVEVDISHAEIEQYYEDNKSLFITPEVRDIYHIIFDNKADAVSAASEISSFDDFATLAEVRGAEVDSDNFSLGFKSKDELLPDIAKKTFGDEAGLIESPVSTQLGWHLFFVKDVKEESKRNLDDASDEIAEILITQHRNIELGKLVQDVDTDLMSGLSLNDIAKDYDMKIKSRTFSYGNPLINDTLGDVMLEKMKSQISHMLPDEVLGVEYEESTEKYYLLRLQDVKPQGVKEFSEVREKVLKTWESENRIARASDIFNELKELISSGNSDLISDFIAEQEMEVKKDLSLEARGSSDEFSREVFASLISLNFGGVSDLVVDDKSGNYLIGVCKGIKVDFDGVDKDELEKNITNIKGMLQSSNKQIIVGEFFEYLKNKYSVKTNDSIIYREINTK